MSRLSWARSLLAASVFGSVGCASGKAWVQEPEDALNPSAELAHAASPDRATLSVAHTGESRPAPADDVTHHRLDHVVSLGESEASAPPPASLAGPIDAPGPVVVNIVNQSPPTYGYALGYYGPSPVAARRSQLGLSHAERTSTPRSEAPRSAEPRGIVSRSPAPRGNWVVPPSRSLSPVLQTAPASPRERTP